ncbi:uncharacterized protein LOC131174119 [Hevea brasiliensis]|uniref:uncharacterized protein LOC131174119 n=1 Tax=Hevea brasiliensis TaxID=3981 RepID=UPI0025D370AB|nr:uncharacterized protein LOC131174119 [Hevea brasiliensis]
MADAIGDTNLINFIAIVSMQLSTVKTLNGSNFDDWKEYLSMYLAIAQLDLALRVNAPAKLINESTVAEKIYHEKWQNSNRVVAEKFKKFDNTQKSHYLSLLEHTQYDGVSAIWEHLMTLISYFNKLKSFDINLGESFLVRRILKSLPPQFKILKTSYNS